jgi:hypothetical protein
MKQRAIIVYQVDNGWAVRWTVEQIFTTKAAAIAAATTLMRFGLAERVFMGAEVRT